jgi:hypothetical protein
MNPVPLETLTLSKFFELLRSHFLVSRAPPHQHVQLELVQVTPGGTVAGGGAHAQQYESFSLMFDGAQSQPLGQGTYLFEHPQIGSFDLFIVPIAAENGRLHYQAVFNRLVQTP